ncbi:hypothetical protein [Flavobacterium sp.]|uniref:hypothetical protein n=1 Tax=Flavobacterium sp. TaxID=239 RepID=UPI0039E6D234
METPQEKTWREDPKNWKWGLFYYNPEDKRLFPRKQLREMGWTTNFANPKSILAMIALIGGSIGIILGLAHFNSPC